MDNFDTFEKSPTYFKEVSRFMVQGGEMKKETIVKNKFSQLNDKRIYFPNGILSLPFHHSDLKELNKFKEKMELRNIFGMKKKRRSKLKTKH